MSDTYLHLTKAGDRLGLRTNASTTGELADLMAVTLARAIEEGEFESDWLFQLEQWMPAFAEACAIIERGKVGGREVETGVAGQPTRLSSTSRGEGSPTYDHWQR